MHVEALAEGSQDAGSIPAASTPEQELAIIGQLLFFIDPGTRRSHVLFKRE